MRQTVFTLRHNGYSGQLRPMCVALGPAARSIESFHVHGRSRRQSAKYAIAPMLDGQEIPEAGNLSEHEAKRLCDAEKEGRDRAKEEDPTIGRQTGD